MSSIASYFNAWADKIILESSSTPLLFVSGAQGIGKSTAMKQLFSTHKGEIAILGLDDFYLSKAERMKLAQEVSPLFETRGPPGTHDIPLFYDVLNQLTNATATSKTKLPVFDKTMDERAPAQHFKTFQGKPRAIVFEGWLIGALPMQKNETDLPLNRIEAEDKNAKWRNHQEVLLNTIYADLWDKASHFFHIEAPSFEIVAQWRIQQEETTLGLQTGTLPRERREWVENFVLYYERLTKRMLDGGKRDGVVLKVDATRQPQHFQEKVL